MDYLSGFGMIALFVLFTYLAIRYYNKQDHDERERKNLISKSSNARQVLWDKEHGLISPREADKKIDQIIRDPIELQAIRDKELETIKQKREIELMYRNMRKIGYQYEKKIYEIFGSLPYLESEELLLRIKSKYNCNDLQAKDMQVEWLNNLLVQRQMNNKNRYRVGSILLTDQYSLDESDLNWTKWLKLNNMFKPEIEL